MKAGRLKEMKSELCRFDQATGFLFAGRGYKVTKPRVAMARMYPPHAKRLLLFNVFQIELLYGVSFYRWILW